MYYHCRDRKNLLAICGKQWISINGIHLYSIFVAYTTLRCSYAISRWFCSIYKNQHSGHKYVSGGSSLLVLGWPIKLRYSQLNLCLQAFCFWIKRFYVLSAFVFFAQLIFDLYVHVIVTYRVSQVKITLNAS